MVSIGGLQKTSLIDYPENICTVIFLQGCNFKCGFCHNPELIIKGEGNLSEDEVFSFLKSRKKLVDGVCITGGEPTIQKDLIEFVKKIKDIGFLIKMDTNGSNPEMIKELIERKLVDYIAMDLKVDFENYKNLVDNFDVKKIKESVKIIKEGCKDYEFRMTVHPSFQTKEDVISIAKYLKGSKKFVLQQFYFNNKIVDPKYQNIEPFSREEIEEMKKECGRFLNTEARI